MAEQKNGSSDNPVATDAPSSPAIIATPSASDSCGLVTAYSPFPHHLPFRLNIVLGQNGKAYSVRTDAGNHYVLPVGGKQLNNLIRQIAQAEGITLRKADISDINSLLQAHAESARIVSNVWIRVAPYAGGVEIDLGDEKHTRVRITAGGVELVTSGSETLFQKSPVSLPLPMPAKVGNLSLLKRYLNLTNKGITFYVGWLTYILAHAKVPASKYPILVLLGNQGSGKSDLAKITIKLLDPSIIGVQVLPNNARDLAIAAQHAHVLCFDNVRGFKPLIADILCIAATGGAYSTRQLYSDADLQVLHLHVALVLNGIHSFIDQADLAQRVLPIEMPPIVETDRKSEAQLFSEFEADLPEILRGLYDRTAEILRELPSVGVTHPERMIEFVQWLGGMERIYNIPKGTYQAAYSEALNQGQLESLLDNLVAAAIVEFAEDEIKDAWTGTPTELLAKLTSRASRGTQRSREWPLNAISLSKRLGPLRASLLTQGIRVDLTRGKFRTISISKRGEL